jgi:hypothetical protein
MSKNTLLTIGIIICLTVSSYAQDVGIAIAPTIDNVLYYQFVAGGPQYRAKGGYNVTVDCLLKSDKKIHFGSSLSYQYSQFKVIPTMDSPEFVMVTEGFIYLLSFSFKTSYITKKDFYLSLDPCIDLQLLNSHKSIDNQSGIGLSPALGKLFKISETVLLRIEPRLWFHNIITFSSDDLQLHLTQAGINIGFVFRSNEDNYLKTNE